MAVVTDFPSIALSRELKEHTAQAHESLDQRIMALRPFADERRYVRFLRMQLRLHHATAALYGEPGLLAWLPCLADGNRLEAVVADCADFNVSEAEYRRDRAAARAVSIPTTPAALGWLYVQEGSRLGAAVLRRQVRRELGLSDVFGARHLAGPADGRARHWQRFREALDAIDLTAGERGMAAEGAAAAFAFVRESVEELLADGRAVDTA